MNNIIIGTGWCAREEGHNNPKVSKILQQPDYLDKVWRAYIEAFVKPYKYFLYVSNCDIKPKLSMWMRRNCETVRNVKPERGQDHRHDWCASLMMGAEYALCNGCDFVYIEQDCLVYGLDKALEWAYGQNANIAYGFGENCSFYKGWSESSFFYVHNGFLPFFLDLFNRSRVHEWTKSPVPEVWWTNMFTRIVDWHVFRVKHWPFGYGRKRPIDFDEEVFYAQQLTDGELNNFMKKLKGAGK